MSLTGLGSGRRLRRVRSRHLDVVRGAVLEVGTEVVGDDRRCDARALPGLPSADAQVALDDDVHAEADRGADVARQLPVAVDTEPRGRVGDELTGLLVHPPVVDGEPERRAWASGRQGPGLWDGCDCAAHGDGDVRHCSFLALLWGGGNRLVAPPGVPPAQRGRRRAVEGAKRPCGRRLCVHRPEHTSERACEDESQARR